MLYPIVSGFKHSPLVEHVRFLFQLFCSRQNTPKTEALTSHMLYMAYTYVHNRQDYTLTLLHKVLHIKSDTYI